MEINIQELKEKLYKRLESSGWDDALKAFVLSSDMDKILSSLYEEYLDNKRFTPTLAQVFNAFECCPYKDLKVVMLGQDPYQFLLNGENVADGLAFSCSNTRKIQPSLAYMNKELAETVYKGQPYKYQYDLRPWAKQGVLLINTALTTTIGHVGSHYILWKDFIIYLLDYLMWNNPGLIYVFMGAKAQKYYDLIPENNYKIKTIHPAAAAHSKWESWDSGDMFNKINGLLEKSKKQPIKW